MSAPTLTPRQQTSVIVLPATGTLGTGTDGAGALTHYPFGIYVDTDSDLFDRNFITGAADQVAYTFKKLGGDVLDIELTVGNIYAAYEEATLEYSYILNVHQSKNILHSSLGATTGTFDSDGQRTDSLSGSNVELKYPKFKFTYGKKVMENTSNEVGIGGTLPIYSASIAITSSRQNYDLQKIVSASSATDTDSSFYNKFNNKKITIKRVYCKTPHAMWRFYGYYGGLNAVGNLSNYGQYSDDSTFEVIPTWQNKMQAIMYEDSIYTRTSHYSYELIDNNLRLFPTPSNFGFDHLADEIWFKFYIDQQPFQTGSYNSGVEGVNNINTVPFDNLPFKNINSMGMQWIRKYSLALCKEMLGQIRGKFTTMPIPGESVTLNHSELLSQAKEEQQQLREKLTELLKEVEYPELAKKDQELSDAATNVLKISPLGIYVG